MAEQKTVEIPKWFLGVISTASAIMLSIAGVGIRQVVDMNARLAKIEAQYDENETSHDLLQRHLRNPEIHQARMRSMQLMLDRHDREIERLRGK